MKRVALALPGVLEGPMLENLSRHGYEVRYRATSGEDLAASVDRVRVDVAITSASETYLSAALLAACDREGVRLVALAATDAERRSAADLGLREIVAASASWSEIEAMLHVDIASVGGVGGVGGVGAVGSAPPPASLPPAGAPTDPPWSTAPMPASSAASPRGSVIAVWGPAGAPGRTTVAITIAAELAAAGCSVALADADTHSGSIAPALGMLDEAPGFAAACRLAGSDALDRTELERVGQRYHSGHGSFWVLTGIGRPNRWPELSAERVQRAIDECRGWVDFTVIDTSFSLENDEEISSDLFAPRRNAATITALAKADRVIAVGAADPVGLSRFLRAHVDLVNSVEPERITVVMNKVRSSAIGLNPTRQVEETLQRFGGIAAPVIVPHDQAALDSAVLSGRTLPDVAAKSPARVALRSLVTERILPEFGSPAAPVWAPRSRFAPQPSS